jgi:hypothetical protein
LLFKLLIFLVYVGAWLLASVLPGEVQVVLGLLLIALAARYSVGLVLATPIFIAVIISWCFLRLKSGYTDFEKYEAALKVHKAATEQYDREYAAYQEQLRTRLAWWQALSGHRFEKELGILLGKRGYAVEPTPGSN